MKYGLSLMAGIGLFSSILGNKIDIIVISDTIRKQFHFQEKIMETVEKTTEQLVCELLKQCGIEYKFTFVPKIYADIEDCMTSKSLSSLQFDWKVSIQGETFEYHQGLGLQQSTKNLKTYGSINFGDAEKIKWALCGKRYITAGGMPSLKPKTPEITDVIYCLLSDSDAIEYNFTEWANDFGYDTDSIKAEKVYQACVETGRKLNRIFSPKDLESLRELLQDY